MPEEDAGLSHEFIKHQRRRLEQLRNQLLRVGNDTRDEVRELDEGRGDEPRDDGDEGANMQQRQIDESRLGVNERRLRDVERALAKIDEGTYGLSDESGEPIARERLEAIPEAVYTVEEMSQRERRFNL
jgi:DnaK suppressor protein